MKTGMLLAYIAVMAGVTYLIRMLPLTVFQKKIKSSKLNNCAYFLYNCSPISRTVLIIICLYQLSFSVSMRR